MKLVLVSPFPERVGGAEQKLYTFVRHLDRTRIEVVFIFLGSGDLVDAVRGLGYRTHVLPTARLRRGGKLFPTVARLRRIFKGERPDLILNWGTKAQVMAWPAARLAGIADRLVWMQLATPTRRLDTTTIATLLPARAVIASSHVSAHAQEGSWPRRRTYVVHPGVEPPRDVPEPDRIALRSSLGIPDGRLVIGSVARLQRLKRQDHLIRAIATLVTRGHDVHGVLVGGDAYGLDPGFVRELHELVDRLGLAERVSFTGQVKDPVPYLQVMDVFVLPSPNEGFGIVLIEAMSNRLPSIAVKTSGPAEIIEDGRSGVLVERADADLFANAIEPLVEDASLRERLGETGQRRQRELFTSERMAKEMTARLLEIAAEGRAG